MASPLGRRLYCSEEGTSHTSSFQFIQPSDSGPSRRGNLVFQHSWVGKGAITRSLQNLYHTKQLEFAKQLGTSLTSKVS